MTGASPLCIGASFPLAIGLRRCCAALLYLTFAVLSAGALAQTTQVSGTVYDPRTTSSSLPLPNVLVYATTGTVPPLPAGVQCLTYSAPADAVSYVTTAADGTFVLDQVPQNATYTVVIQAGKWRRQFTQAVQAAPVTGLSLHMPADHTQGDIPMIAVATGASDGVECVLRDMGIADTEFTDDTGSKNPGGHIHLYAGSDSPGAVISASTPDDSKLLTDSTVLNGYDMAMFPCRGMPYSAADVEQQNLASFANAGGRIFATHYSYIWLDPDNNSAFPPVANWNPSQLFLTSGTATVNTGFTDGATLAQWLQDVGASASGQLGQVNIQTVRSDVASVIPPTQVWLTLNGQGSPSPIMQMTFNTPVGAAGPAQCGRVLFNEYHVIDQAYFGFSSPTFPNNCPSAPMTAQEEMLEYALFDLSNFVQPVVVPTLSVSFDPSPLSVRQNDPADQVTIHVTNTSANTPVASTAVLTLALPAGMTAATLADSGGGWICTVNSLQCTRTTVLGAAATDSVVLTASVASYPPGGPASPTGLITATVSSPVFSNDVVATDTVIFEPPAPVSWATPAAIVYPTPLSGTQLDATSPVPGVFVYSPAAGTILPPGQHTLNAGFTPDDRLTYASSTASVVLTVVPGAPAITFTGTPNPAFLQNPVQFAAQLTSAAAVPTGTMLFADGAVQLNSGSLDHGAATFTTSSLGVGAHRVTASYSGDTNYAAVSSTVSLVVMDFALDLSGATHSDPSVTVRPGNTAKYFLLLSPIGGQATPADVGLSVAGLPTNAIAAFSPAVIQAGSGATAVELDVTPPPTQSAQTRRSPLERAFPVVLGLMVLPFARRMRRAGGRWAMLAALAIATIGLVGASGCGSLTYTPKSSQLTITAKSGALAHTAAVTLVVE